MYYPPQLPKVTSIADIYTFIEDFDVKNKLLKATGDLYWCDPRYMDELGLTEDGEGGGISYSIHGRTEIDGGW
jgi:hypothetical protein